MDIVSRLKRFIDAHQIPVTQFADNCRIPRPTLSQLLNGRNKKVSDEVISKIHQAYPRLSVLWLMFGEGAMESPANIEMSGAQKSMVLPVTDVDSTDSMTDDPRIDFESGYNAREPEKSSGNDDGDPDDRFPQFPGSGRGKDSAMAEIPAASSSATITFGDKGKRVISIVVYYDDNSYESFVPDPTGRSPFAR